MLKRCLLTVLLCGATAASFATTISLKGSAGAGWAALTWTVANGGVNAQEVYRDTDADPSGRVRIASLAASARSYTDAAVTTGRTYGYWIKARESTDNAAFDSNAVALIPRTRVDVLRGLHLRLEDLADRVALCRQLGRRQLDKSGVDSS